MSLIPVAPFLPPFKTGKIQKNTLRAQLPAKRSDADYQGGNGEETSDDPRSPRKLLRYLWLGTATHGLAKRRGRRDNRTCRELRHRAASRTSISKRPLAASDRAWR